MTDETTPAGRAQQSTEGPGTGSGSPRQSQARMSEDFSWRVDTFVASAPNPPWEVRVTHVPSGTVRTAAGRGHGHRRAALELRADIEAALRG